MPTTVRRRLCWLSAPLALASACLLTAASARAVTIQDVPLAVPVNDILSAGDGGVWVALDGALGHALPDGRLDQTYDVEVQPSGAGHVDHLAYGPDGRPWFTITRGQAPDQVTTIASLAPDRTIREFPLKTPDATVEGLVAGADGNLWFGETGEKRAIGRLAPDGLVTEFTGLSDDPGGPVSATDGSLWYAGPAGMLGSSTLAGVLGTLDVGAEFGPIAADPQRRVLWLGGATDPSAILRVDLQSSTVRTFPLAESDAPVSLAAAADGNIWFAERHVFGRITPDGRVTEYPGPLGFDNWVRKISGGPGPAVWYMKRTGVGRISLDPPVIAPRNPSAVGPHAVTLATAATPGGSATSVHFEYGATSAYGTETPSTAAGDGDDPVTVTAEVGGLAAKQVLHYRAVATSVLGTTHGPDQTLVTTPEPVPADPDVDGDGYPASVDCNDRDPRVHAAARDIPGDGVDEDCSGSDAAFPRFTPRTIAKWDTYGRAYSIFTVLAVNKVPAGTRVELSCRGRGCRFSHWHKTVRRATARLRLLKVLKHSHLRHGSRLELRLVRPAAVGALLRWDVGPPPRQVVKCLVPGMSKVRSC
jgi:streptogramin lyase